jgi:hypothetical protein
MISLTMSLQLSAKPSGLSIQGDVKVKPSSQVLTVIVPSTSFSDIIVPLCAFVTALPKAETARRESSA